MSRDDHFGLGVGFDYEATDIAEAVKLAADAPHLRFFVGDASGRARRLVRWLANPSSRLSVLRGQLTPSLLCLSKSINIEIIMQLGFVSAIVPELSLEEVFQTAEEIGYDCVELMCWPIGKAARRYAGVTHIDVRQLDEAATARIKELASRHGVSISGLGYYPNPLAPDVEEATQAVQQIERVIAAAAKISVKTVNTFVGRDWSRSMEDNWPRFREVWEPLVRAAEEHDVRIGIENCPMLFTQDEWPGGKNLAVSPVIWRRMFEDIPSSHFGLNYDPSHMVWQQMDYLKPLREFSEKIFHVHAKDVRVDRHRLDEVGILAHPLDYHTPKLPGLGGVDWGQFFSVLGDAGFQGPVCVEVEDRAFEDSLASRRLALQQSHTFLRNFIPRPSPASH